MEAVVKWIEKLTGDPPAQDSRPQLPKSYQWECGGMGYSQFNELLLSLGYDRVSRGFFRYVFEDAESIDTFRRFRSGIERFRKKAMLRYGNFKYAYKTHSKQSFEEIGAAFRDLEPKAQTEYCRHNPLVQQTTIKRTDTPCLGYILQRQIKQEIESADTPDKRKDAKRQQQKMSRTITKGKKNHDLYLTYDHMDVYIATSMRTPFDFWNVNRFIDNLFSTALLSDLRLRWFDPTQAYCEDRIDKGLVEGLMLKRAECTIYLAQESETLGKDSELATTLAQGKPVIAYVPRLRSFESFRDDYANRVIAEVYPGRPRDETVMEFLELYYPKGAWREEKIRQWLDRPSSRNFDKVLRCIHEKANEMYNKRAEALREDHPLGLQVNLDTGVANGVLVVRTVPGCAKVLRMILTRKLEFDVEETSSAYLLRERTTHSVYRVVTKDRHLTNAFWNFYPEVKPPC